MTGCGIFLFPFVIWIVAEAVGWILRSSRMSRAADYLRIPSGTVLRAEGRLLGHPYEIRDVRDREANAFYTRLVVDLRGSSPGVLKVAPPGWPARVARMFGPQDLLIGNRTFDRDFVVMANPESLATRVFSPERRERLIASVRRLGHEAAPFIDLTRDTLSVGVVRELLLPGNLRVLEETAREFLEAIGETRAMDGITWVEAAPGEAGTCEVCGTELRERVVHCARCRTPHHEECWTYTGECSTYACQERAYLKEGRRVQPRASRQTPDDWLHDEMARNRRDYGPR